MIRFKLRTRRFFEDADKAPMMLSKGKLAAHRAAGWREGRAQGPVPPGRTQPGRPQPGGPSPSAEGGAK